MSTALVRLGERVDTVTVGWVGPMANEYVSTGVPFLRSNNIRAHNLELSDVRYISQDFHARIQKSRLNPGDVVVVRTGKPGVAACIPSGLPEMNCSDLVIIRPGKLLSGPWLSYYINAAAGGFVASRVVGAVQQHFNVGAARDMLIPDLPKREQEAVAAVLGALGDKAAANIVLASTAEALAAAYVASSLSSCSVSELAALDLRAVTPKSLGTRLVPHYSIPAFDRDQRPTMDATADIKSNKFLIDDARVLVSKLNPRLPRVWVVDNVTGLPGLASTEMLPLAATEVSYRVLKAALSRPEFGHQLESQVAGTSGSHQRVSPHDVMNTDVPDPRELPPNLLAAIDTLVALATQARRENVALADLRDTLLPDLMSGRLRVKDAERQVEDGV